MERAEISAKVASAQIAHSAGARERNALVCWPNTRAEMCDTGKGLDIKDNKIVPQKLLTRPDLFDLIFLRDLAMLTLFQCGASLQKSQQQALYPYV